MLYNSTIKTMHSSQLNQTEINRLHSHVRMNNYEMTTQRISSELMMFSFLEMISFYGNAYNAK